MENHLAQQLAKLQQVSLNEKYYIELFFKFGNSLTRWWKTIISK
jgi:hypothetical protein